MADFAVGEERAQPTGRGRELFTVDENMIADEETVFHGTGRDFEILKDKRHDEEDDDEHFSQGGKKLQRRLGRFFVDNDRLLLRRHGMNSFQNFLANQFQSSGPTCFVKEVNDDVGNEAEPIGDRSHLVLIGWRDEGPVDEHGTADDISLGNKSPEAAIVADVAIVSHGEVAVGGDNDVFTLDMGR